MGAFIWKTNRGQACGGIRLWNYKTIEDYLRDGMRLAIGMGTKSALAGLWAGGGKGVVVEPSDGSHRLPDYREKLFLDYGNFLSSLNGCYVAAEDVGLNVADLNNVHKNTRYTTCISELLGGSGNPSVATGKGVVCAMEGALDFLRMGTLEGKSLAIQGAGNVASVIIDELLMRNVKHIYVTDVHDFRIKEVQERFAYKAGDRLVAKKVPMNDNSVLAYPCDIVSPCALGNILNEKTIPTIRAKIVCGAANNQLGNESHNQLLDKHNITYVVDFLANRMGIVNCANEAYGRLPNDPAILRHFDKNWEYSIFNMTKTILQKAADNRITAAQAALEMALKLSEECHPIWPGRSLSIIKALVDTKWHEGNDFWRQKVV